MTAVAYFLGGQLLAPANFAVGDPPIGLGIEELTLTTSAGTSVAAWHWKATGSRATVILLHPIRGSRLSMLSRAELLHQHGYDVLLIDLQAHGETAGEAITLGRLERLDVAAAVDFVRRQSPEHSIGVIGRSLGGAAALLASPLGVDAMVLESVYPTIEEAVRDRLQIRLGPLAGLAAPWLLVQLRPRLGLSAADLRPIEHIAEVGCPVLVMSGERDRHTTIEETRRLYKRAAEPKRLVEFAGAGHVDLLAHDPALYEESIIVFLRGAFESPRISGSSTSDSGY